MYKKIAFFILCLSFMGCLVIPADAQVISHVCDNAGLLTAAEISSLEKEAAEISESYQIDAVILTVETLDGVSAQDYAEGYYDVNGYGEDGVLFLLAITEREWYISTCGTVICALTDFGVQQLGNEVIPYLSDGNWYPGFSHFMSQLPRFLNAYINGKPVDGRSNYSGDYYHGEQEDVLYYKGTEANIFISICIGLAAAGITVLIMRAGMNTRRPQRTANDYLIKNSWDLYNRSDIFLYSNVTKTRKQQNSSGSGGSSVHRSSSGRRHGGGGGKF